MSNPVPNDLALSVINTGDVAQSAPLRNNFASIQTAVNELISDLSGGTANQFLQAVDGTDVQWAYPPGYEIGYDQISATVNITGTSSASPTVVIAGSSHTFDGNPVTVEFNCPYIQTPSVAGASLDIGLYEGSTLLGILAEVIVPAAANMRIPIFAKQHNLVPTAGAHTYSIKAWVSSTTGTPFVQANSGTGGNPAPAFLRFTKV